jgi:polysaccharide biosynthesis transport protein
MSSRQQAEQSGGISLGEIYFTLFRHKWKILFFSVAGVAAAVTLLLVKPPMYASAIKLDILYVVQTKSLNLAGGDANTLLPDDRGSSVIQTEVEILKSWDVVMEAAQTLGPEKILAKAGGGNNANAAAGLLARNLIIESSFGSSVIQVILQHPDPELVQPLLSGIIASYCKKHTEIHLGSVISSDFSMQETNRLYKALAQTRDELRSAKNRAGVFSVDGGDKSYEEQLAQIRSKLFTAQAELVERKEMLRALANASPAGASVTNAATPVFSSVKVNEYRNLCARLDLLRKKEQELLLQYTDQSVPIKDLRAQIAGNESLKRKLELEEPKLASLGVPAGQVDQPVISLVDNEAQITMLETRVKILNSQLTEIQSSAAKNDESKTTIAELLQRQRRQEAELEYFLRNLEQARVDRMIGAGKAPNIGIIQSPTPAFKQWSKKLKKKASILAVGGIGFGLALAFLIEMFLDRSFKRPVEVEAKLRLPLLVSIPNFNQNGYRPGKATAKTPLLLTETTGAGKDKPVNAAIESWNRQHPLRRFCDGLRDRVIVHFDVKGVTRHPKLVGITSCDKGAGVTSVAAGLAASLSETGDGNVLLVDMNTEGGAARQFYKGKPGCGLDAALEGEARKEAQVQENLYVATEPVDNTDKLPSVLPKHLLGLIPKLKASDYDYIIFDMPAVTQTSMTPRLARLMDMVLLVIEAEKTNREVAQKVISLLGESKASVTTVLNKTRSYIPARLYRENLNDS